MSTEQADGTGNGNGNGQDIKDQPSFEERLLAVHKANIARLRLQGIMVRESIVKSLNSNFDKFLILIEIQEEELMLFRRMEHLIVTQTLTEEQLTEIIKGLGELRAAVRQKYPIASTAQTKQESNEQH